MVSSYTQLSNFFCFSEVSVTSVVELPRRPLLKRGSTVTLLCNVSVVTTGPTTVEVQWLQKKEEPEGKGDTSPQDTKGSVLATLTYDGIARIYSNGSDLSVDRISASTYRLRIFSAREEDQGHYQCQAEVWAQDPHGGWYRTGARTDSSMVRVYLFARGKCQEILSWSQKRKSNVALICISNFPSSSFLILCQNIYIFNGVSLPLTYVGTVISVKSLFGKKKL